MFTVVITEKGGEQRRLEFDKNEINIGRVQGNEITLPKGNVSKKHSRIVVKDGKFIIVDLKSTNGTYVNGRKITSPLVIKEGDKVYIGDFILSIESSPAETVAAVAVVPSDEPESVSEPEIPRQPPPPPRPARTSSEVNPVSAMDPMESSQPMKRPTTRSGPPAPPPPKRKTTGVQPAVTASVEAIEPEPPKPVIAPMSKPLSQPRMEAPAPMEMPRSEPRRERPTALVREEPSLLEIRREIYDQISFNLGLDGLPVERQTEELRNKVERAVSDLVEGYLDDKRIPPVVDHKVLVKDLLSELVGLGPLQLALDDPEVDVILVNGPRSMFVERKGKLEEFGKRFSSEKSLLSAITRLVAPLGVVLSADHPVRDLRLRNGQHLNLILPPLAVQGPCLTLTKSQRRTPYAIDELVEQRVLSDEMVSFLESCIASRTNVLISGPRGVGKTTLLNALCNKFPAETRLVTIEEVIELRYLGTHWVQLESKLPDAEGKYGISLVDLIRNAQRMRPERMVVGECTNGHEAMALLQAINSGAEGTFTTLRTEADENGLLRFETLVERSGVTVSRAVLRKELTEAIGVVVQMRRLPDGKPRVTRVSEVMGVDAQGSFRLKDVFMYDDGRGTGGSFVATGTMASLTE